MPACMNSREPAQRLTDRFKLISAARTSSTSFGPQRWQLTAARISGSSLFGSTALRLHGQTAGAHAAAPSTWGLLVFLLGAALLAFLALVLFEKNMNRLLEEREKWAFRVLAIVVFALVLACLS
jgi:hypothetical protein